MQEKYSIIICINIRIILFFIHNNTKKYFPGRTNVRITNTSGVPGQGRGDSGVPASIPKRWHRKRSAFIYNIVYCRLRRRRRISGRKETSRRLSLLFMTASEIWPQEDPREGRKGGEKGAFSASKRNLQTKWRKMQKIVANATKWPSFRGYSAIFKDFGLSARYWMLSNC